MRFQEYRCDPKRNSGARQDRRKFSLAARSAAEPARYLDRMGRVHHDRIARLRHNRQAAHVADQGIIAKARSALGEQYAMIARTFDLGNDLRHVPRRKELAFLDVDCGPCLPCRQKKISLTAQKGRNLKNVNGSGGFLALLGKIHIRQGGAADRAPNLIENCEAVTDARAAGRSERGPVGFEDEAQSGLIAEIAQVPRNGLGVGQALKLAGTSDQSERQGVADPDLADLDLSDHDETCSLKIETVSEIMR